MSCVLWAKLYSANARMCRCYFILLKYGGFIIFNYNLKINIYVKLLCLLLGEMHSSHADLLTHHVGFFSPACLQPDPQAKKGLVLLKTYSVCCVGRKPPTSQHSI